MCEWWRVGGGVGVPVTILGYTYTMFISLLTCNRQKTISGKFEGNVKNGGKLGGGWG